MTDHTSWKYSAPSWKLPLWQWGVILAFCISTAIIFNTLFFLQYVVSTATSTASTSQQQSTNVAFWTFLPSETTRRAAWFLMIPIALHYARMLPIHSPQGLGRAWRQFFVHAILSVGFALLCALCTTALVYVLVPVFFPLRTLVSPAREFVNHLTIISGFVASVVLYWLILGGTNALAYYRAFRDQSVRAAALEVQLAQAQLYALQMQLNPHFLFNALNSVSSLLYEDIRRADTMLARLGEFLRMTLNAPSAQYVTLEKELEFVQGYLDIEQMRFEERVGVEQHITPDVLSASVPTFLLQPLVENALKHGILPSAQGGTITISARRTANQLQLEVRNTRTERYSLQKSDRLQDTVSGHHGIGLSNTRARLEKLYGTAYSLGYGVVTDGHYAVAITIPFHRFDIQQQ